MSTMIYTDGPGYLDNPYLEDGYNVGHVYGSLGFQANVVIENYPRLLADQMLAFITTGIEEHGYQFHVIVDKSDPRGAQFKAQILDALKNNGFQAQILIEDQHAVGMEFRYDNYQSFPITGYLDDDYLGSPYLTGYFGPRLPTQAYVDVETTDKTGTQSLVNIIDFDRILGTEAEVFIANTMKTNGFQFNIINTQGRVAAFQFGAEIIGRWRATNFQFHAMINAYLPIGTQFNVVTQVGKAFQFFGTVYNTDNLRILHDFKSRGTTNTNWSANTQMTGDFSANNFDSDIVEKCWRSDNTVKSGIKITCDVGVTYKVYVDTLAILAHNMTVGANIQLLMSDDPNFIVGVDVIQIPARRYDTYYIAEYLPTKGYRYFRFQIDDPTNPNDYIEIGKIMFGSADIIHQENFTDEVDFEMVDFSNTINTEGHTNVMNSRALKRKLTLNFQSLNYYFRNYDILRYIFQTYRTTHKCLWIPTPNVFNQDVTDRLRIFGKLITVPKERHNNKGGMADYISFTVELDESL